MRGLRKAAGAAIVLAVALGDVVLAQKNPYRKYTAEKFVENMQTAARNYTAVNEFLGQRDYAAAKGQLTRVREHLAVTVTFWRDQKKDDAVTMLKSAIRAVDGLDVALSSAQIDPANVQAASERVTASCRTCHAAYREQDPVTKAYRIKAAALQ